MIDGRNNGNLTGGLVADPEILGNNGNVVRLRIASDYAGKDRENPDNRTGYFNVTVFLNDDNTNTKFVRSQIENGNLKKGSQVAILYRLQQDRWEKDGQKMSNVTLVAESLNYAGSGGNRSEGESGGSSSQESSEMPNEF